MENWVLVQKRADFAHIVEKFHISPRLARLIRNRDVVGDEAVDRYLNGTMKDTYDGALMQDMDKAVEILREKITSGSRIRVIGDYDIDGICSTYILLHGLAGLGVQADYAIPDRILDGYGLNENLVRQAYEDGIDTILTCDNGISAAKAVALGKSLGMTMVVTDHHEVPFEADTHRMILPEADAVVDPKRSDSAYPFQGLCGAAVAYKLLTVLYPAMGADPKELDPLLEEVGFATVGDVMDLVDENRILVREGLKRLRKTENPGLTSLMRCKGVNKEEMDPHDIGYILGPCINASGRLDTARRSLALLEAETGSEADRLAEELNAINEERKNLTEVQAQAALAQVEENGWQKDPVLVLYLPDCHESLAGLVASRVRKRYYRPVFVLTDGEELIKGSGRSIEGYHMFEGLSRCQDLLETFGGHAMAAGLSLRPLDAGTGKRDGKARVRQVQELRQRLLKTCSLTTADLTEKIRIDMELPFAAISPEFVRELERMEPFGNGNPEPLFAARQVSFLYPRLMGKNKNLLRMRAVDAEGTAIDAICFQGLDGFFELLEDKYGPDARRRFFGPDSADMKMDITFCPEINTYGGASRLQIAISHFR